MMGHNSAEPLWLIVKLAAWAVPFIPGAILAGFGSAYLVESPSSRRWAVGLAILLGVLGVLQHARQISLSDWGNGIGSLVFGAIVTSACLAGWALGTRFRVSHARAA